MAGTSRRSGFRGRERQSKPSTRQGKRRQRRNIRRQVPEHAVPQPRAVRVRSRDRDGDLPPSQLLGAIDQDVSDGEAVGRRQERLRFLGVDPERQSRPRRGFSCGAFAEDFVHDALGGVVDDAAAADVAEIVRGWGDGFPDRPHDVGLPVQWGDELVDIVVGDLETVIQPNLVRGTSSVGRDHGVPLWDVIYLVVSPYVVLFRYGLWAELISSLSLCRRSMRCRLTFCFFPAEFRNGMS